MLSELPEIDKEILDDLLKLHELDLLAYSNKGITLDQSIERRDLQIKYKELDKYGTLLSIMCKWLHP